MERQQIGRGTWRRHAGALLVAALLPLFGARAEPPKAPASPERPKERVKVRKPEVQRSPKDWFARWLKGSDFRKYSRTSPQVLDAFRPMVATAGRSTVRILVDGTPKALGTIVDADGYIATKASEVAGKSLQVEIADGTNYVARKVGENRHHDLALLKVDVEKLPAIVWESHSEPAAGSWLAAPAPGGKPLAIGVVGHRSRWIRGGVLGIMMRQVEGGPRIEGVHPKGGAAKAGLKKGDVILRVEGRVVKNVSDAVQAVGSYLPGEKIKVAVQRGEEELEVEAKLGGVYESFGNKRAVFQNRLGSALSKRRAGFPSALTHDLALAPNECGGPLVDSSGKAVGINIARSGRVITLAIPARVARPLIDELIRADQAVASRAAPETHPVANPVSKAVAKRTEM